MSSINGYAIAHQTSKQVNGIWEVVETRFVSGGTAANPVWTTDSALAVRFPRINKVHACIAAIARCNPSDGYFVAGGPLPFSTSNS